MRYYNSFFSSKFIGSVKFKNMSTPLLAESKGEDCTIVFDREYRDKVFGDLLVRFLPSKILFQLDLQDPAQDDQYQKAISEALNLELGAQHHYPKLFALMENLAHTQCPISDAGETIFQLLMQKKPLNFLEFLQKIDNYSHFLEQIKMIVIGIDEEVNYSVDRPTYTFCP